MTENQEPGGTKGHSLRKYGGSLQVRPKEAGNLIKLLNLIFKRSHSKNFDALSFFSI